MGSLGNKIGEIFADGIFRGKKHREQAQSWEKVLVGSEGKIRVTIPAGTVVVGVVNHVAVMNASPIECDVESR